MKKLLVLVFAAFALLALTQPAYSTDVQVGKRCQVYDSNTGGKHVHVCISVYKHAGVYSYARAQVWSLAGERPASVTTISINYWSSQHGVAPWCQNNLPACQGNAEQADTSWTPGTTAGGAYYISTGTSPHQSTYCNVHGNVYFNIHWPAGATEVVNLNSFDGNVAPICTP